jgi:MoxR-like ATPase
MLREKLLALMGEVNAITAERDELVEAIAIALLTRKNLFILGDTGQAKSYVINEFRKRITGARQFERLLSKQADEEQLFGRIDLKSLIDGNPKLITKGKIPDSHIVFVDECFKANDGILNALLTALNERRFTNEGETVDIPVISFFAASNEIPSFKNPEDAILKPLYDRLELKLVTEYIQDKNERLRVLEMKQSNTRATPTCAISLDELYAMQDEAEGVAVPGSLNGLMDDILCELRDKGIHISDRKYFGYYPLAKASAWLRGAHTAEPSDLMILRHYLWTEPGERDAIRQVLERRCVNPLREKLEDILQMAREVYSDFEQNVGADATRRIGKLRGEFIDLYETLTNLRTNTQDTSDIQQIIDTETQLEQFSKNAHAATSFTYAPLGELLALRRSA